MTKVASTSKLFIGLMSGTSLDGIDAVVVDFTDQRSNLIAQYSHPIPPALRHTLIKTTNPKWQGSIVDIGTLHQQLGELFAEACLSLIQKSKLDSNDIIAIGSHGQTLWHQPKGDHPFSLQLGDANIISERTGITTVADFRSRDIAAGGQGAPLVPAFHQEFLTHPNKNRALVNIGGIANITLLPSGSSKTEASGYDTGPGNGLIDAWVLKHHNQSYDINGKWAKDGKILQEVLDNLLADNYFSSLPPKSTGKEFFNLEWLEKTLGNLLKNCKPQDIQATLTELTAKSISDNIDKSYSELFVCGGGVHNQFLMDRLAFYLTDASVTSTENININPDWMEAMAFAWFAKQTIEGKTSNLTNVTGAKGKRILGAIYPA